MIENWGNEGMPPEEYDVLDRKTVTYQESVSRTEYIWVRGVHPHLGTIVDGYTGKETFVEKYLYPGIRTRLIRNHSSIPVEHPLYSYLENLKANGK